MARSGRRGKYAAPRTVAKAKVVALGIGALSLLAGLVGESVTAPGVHAASCALTPTLASSTVNQGNGAATTATPTQGSTAGNPLVRGKETLVRLYLTLPSGAATGDSISPTQGSLAISGGAVPSTVPSTYNTLSGTVAPSGAPAIDSPADPMFIIPPADFQPTSTAAFTASLIATITYSFTHAGVTTTGCTTSFTLPAAFVAGQTHNVRILVQPLGDTTKTFSSQFTSVAQQGVVNAVQTISRVYPVPAGIADLSCQVTASGNYPFNCPRLPEAGVLYTINQTLLPIQSLESNGKFCGNSTNLGSQTNGTTLAGQLYQTLQSWNSANSSAPADVILGAVDPSISLGSSSGCAEGLAVVNGPEAWFRSSPDGTSPSFGPAIASMELSHTTGMVNGREPNRTGTNPFHSINQFAEPQGTNRTYNVVQRGVLPDGDLSKGVNTDHTSMNFTGSYSDFNTVLEQPDWQYLLCKLGGPVTATGCTTSGPVGQPAGAEPTFVISGTTDLTPAGTAVSESYFTNDGPLTSQGTTTSLKLVQSTGGTTVRTDPVDASSDVSEHGTQSGSPLTHFTAAVPFSTGADKVQLVSGTTVLYSATRNPNGSPFAEQVTVNGFREYTHNRNNGSFPAITDDGKTIAWKDDLARRLVVAPSSDSEPAATVPGSQASFSGNRADDQAAWSADGRALAFTLLDPTGTNETLYRINVDPTKDPNDPSFFLAATPTALYTTPVTTATSNPIQHPTWSPDGNRIAFNTVLGSPGTPELMTVSATGQSTTATDLGVQGSNPSWSHAPGDSRIAFADPNRNLTTFDPNTGARFTVLASDPNNRNSGEQSYGSSGKIAFGRNDGIWIVNPDGSGLTQLTDFGDDEPSLDGNTLSFRRRIPCGGDCGGSTFIYLLDLTAPGRTVTVVGGAPAGTDPNKLRLDLFVFCHGLFQVAAVAVRPSSVSGQQATFTTVFDTSLNCSGIGGDIGVFAVLNDGFLQSDAADPEARGEADSAAKPQAVAIYSPRAGTPNFLPTQHIEVSGGSTSPDTFVYPDSSLQWFVDSSATPATSGSEADLGTLPVGTHTITLSVLDSFTGFLSTASRTIVVVPDANGDGIPDNNTCGADGHPYVDSLGDGVTNLDRYALTGSPCTPVTSFGAKLKWSPDPLQVSLLTSLLGGASVTITVPGKNIGQIDPSTVRIRLGSTETGPTGTTPDSPGPCPTLTLTPTASLVTISPNVTILAPAWQVSNGSATANLNRAAINDWFVRQCSIRNDAIPVIATGSAMVGTRPAVWSFTGMTTFVVQQ